ncbi:hypothetical protein DSO57_1017415 [Entomophthora muscae]|uniref:Uncharacterized protein n=1 Tax=Entomophthora muscae TaxID=34485 RepID=A0ACC2TFM5_9FUNG|nr:hypothetical protein DSO57_1017415 [Entomophthora muscae]
MSASPLGSSCSLTSSNASTRRSVSFNSQVAIRSFKADINTPLKQEATVEVRGSIDQHVKDFTRDLKFKRSVTRCVSLFFRELLLGPPPEHYQDLQRPRRALF